MLTELDCPPAQTHVGRLDWTPRPGGWDAHAHVFGPATKFPYASPRRYTPPDQTTSDYLRMLDALGILHGVLVQPSVYGTDNDCLVHALSTSQGRLRGIVDLDLSATAGCTLSELTAAGVRGLRIWVGPTTSQQMFKSIDDKLHSLNWHFDIYFTAAEFLVPLLPCLLSLKARLVIEAMGSIRTPAPHGDPAFAALLELLATDRVWVKLSHPYSLDPAGPPYRSVLPLAHALVRARPDRLIWGSDWPHPIVNGGMPNDAALLNLLMQWAGDEGLANQILVANPEELYR